MKYVLPAGTSLQVEIDRNYPMKAGETLDAHLVYALYIDGKLAVPANTVVRGTVTNLAPDRKTRWHARLNLDLTPFHTPKVEFNQIVVGGGALALRTRGAAIGAPVLRLSAPGTTAKKSRIEREWAKVKASFHDRITAFTAPGFGDRAKQMFYSQLPYHPERIPTHTAWTFELAAPLTLPDPPETAAAPPAAVKPGNPEIWSVHALLTSQVTSATAKSGDPIQALVVEPVYDRNRDLVVPQGSTLIGHVTTAKSARSLGRNGKLRFTFQQVRFPQGTTGPTAPDRPVQGALGGATTQGATGLSMDAEGTVTPKSQASAIAPLLLTMLAGRSLDTDGNLTAQAGVGSNGFGLIGRVVGIAAGSRNLAAGIGFYAAAFSTYENFLRHGHDVDFPKDTRIEIDTTPLRAPVLKPQPQQGSL